LTIRFDQHSGAEIGTGEDMFTGGILPGYSTCASEFKPVIQDRHSPVVRASRNVPMQLDF